MYEALARAALAAEDPERVIEAARRMRARHPNLSREQVARKLASRAALSCAAVGVFASGPAALVPGLPVALDLSYQAQSFHRLILSVARVSGRPASPLERLAAAGASVLLASATQAARRQAIQAARRLRARRAPILPLLAAGLAGGAASYAAARLAGLLAERRFFEKRRRRPW
ncbi:MAG TPA: hypothetical protein VGK70_09450 [Thermoanaerobaculia bacterium]|jgi:hypothetical protein